jgi:hypothetical protein
MTRARRLLWTLAPLLWLAGCATSAIPNQPAAMVPGSLSARIPASAPIFVERVALESAARDGTTPFDRWSGSFPLLQLQGRDNYRQGIRLTLQAAGARSSAEPEVYVLRPTILGGLAIPHAEAYAVLFVHYELVDRRTGTLLWAKTVYSQAKLENAQKQTANTPVADPAYGRLAAANLRQMADSLATWFAQARKLNDN